MVKILHTIPALDGGGADRVIYDYCVRMIPQIQFDFIVHSDQKGILEEELEALGCQIYHIKPARNGIFSYIKSIYKILNENNYDMIHVSQGYWGYLYILLAQVCGIKIRIAHAHMANVPENNLTTLKRKIFSKLTIISATDLFACGIDAAKWMWGEKNYRHNNVKIMVNAIDGEKFAFNQNLRNQLRKDWNIQNQFVIGNVGRLAHQKNQSFLLDVFSEIKKLKDNSKLILIGRGELEEELKSKAKRLGLSDSVVFTGVRTDVDQLLNMLDVFVLPSLFEGLPITLIEVQMNGLPTVVSDNITDESKFTDNYLSISLEDSLTTWAEKIISLNTKRISLPDDIKNLRDVNYLAKQQERWYMERLEKM
ncbi:hypothetical protein A9Q68_02010 [Streptococcus bovimastitidis]|uniref:Glycosyl transferase family 1 domain-containing protein n=1 Tax=Streptococcus bovimastitidis TaxID=1856638 RepID=A0A1L8MNL8_9STRE|nr:glycosyltransferase family 1 protein [Streptococcus bovimastitidis]OJF72341.1 hypothetical protein A9Q68_02010 [Streptococcus bovimastitidis]